MAVGSLRAVVVDVGDLEVGERFWGAVSGLPLLFGGFEGRFSRLGRAGGGSILLQLVPEVKGTQKNRVHLDFTVQAVDVAVQEVEALGGRLVQVFGMYPSEERPILESAVVADPFGNEFCVIRDIGSADMAHFDRRPDR